MADKPNPFEQVREAFAENPEALVQRAREHLFAMCRDYRRAFRMSIPAQADDTDILLVGVIDELWKAWKGQPIPGGTMAAALGSPTEYERKTARAAVAYRNAGNYRAFQVFDVEVLPPGLKDVVEVVDHGSRGGGGWAVFRWRDSAATRKLFFNPGEWLVVDMDTGHVDTYSNESFRKQFVLMSDRRI